MTLPPADDLPDGDRGWAGEEFTVHVTVKGTTVTAIYQIEGATVLLASADFGEAEAAMERGDRFMRDDDANPHGA